MPLASDGVPQQKKRCVFVGGGAESESSQLTVRLWRANAGEPGSDTARQLQQQVLDYGNEFS